MKRFLPFLGWGYVSYAAVILLLVSRIIFRVFSIPSAETADSAPSLSMVPLVSLVIVAVAAVAFLSLLGYFLLTRRHRTACIVMAAISCIGVPFGTLLGVLALIALTRPEVRDDYAARVTGASGA